MIDTCSFAHGLTVSVLLLLPWCAVSLLMQGHTMGSLAHMHAQTACSSHAPAFHKKMLRGSAEAGHAVRRRSKTSTACCTSSRSALTASAPVSARNRRRLRRHPSSSLRA